MYVGSCSERQKEVEEEAMNEMTYNEAIEWMDSDTGAARERDCAVTMD